MKFSIFAILLSTVSAVDVNLEGSISTESSLGKKILSNARALNQNNNGYTSWMQNYSIKFDGCVQIPRFEREEGFRSDLLAKFKLCPSDSCGSCWNGGEYVVDLKELIEAYQEAKQMENEQACENAVQSCEYQCQNGYYSYQGDDDEGCQYSCLAAQSMSYCMQDDNQDQAMDDIGECRALNEQEGQNGNNNGNNGYNANYNTNYQVFYVGAYCTSKGVFAGTFKDSACTKKAPSGTYEKFNYGSSLPTEALVPSGCIASCDASAYQNNDNNNNGNNNNNNNDDQNQNAVADVCENLYEQSAKCEKNVNGITYPDTSGCELIKEMLPRANNAFAQMQGKKSAAAIWAWIFGISCVCMGAYIFLLHKRVIRERVDMNKLGLV
ncbi:unnamed protein product [Cylindrotheca closterium]|uniref:Folate receptor-like domain-containing protein n=1 Tax=Cylindrotheca closterium TaxID=2856 RepID=A0AAD2CUK2_9STRA|nr:unnamed protein product [Cylindrotheca closterium]